MSKQKFKKGNLVKVLTGHKIHEFRGGNHGSIDLRPEDIGREAIIDYSYAEKYGGTDIDNYSIVFRDTGASLSWKRTDELEFIDEGGEHLFEEARINKEAAELQESKRYWMIVFSLRSKNLEGFSSMSFISDKDNPLNRNAICDIYVKLAGNTFTRRDLIITNIVEFKNKEDYENFFA